MIYDGAAAAADMSRFCPPCHAAMLPLSVVDAMLPRVDYYYARAYAASALCAAATLPSFAAMLLMPTRYALLLSSFYLHFASAHTITSHSPVPAHSSPTPITWTHHVHCLFHHTAH